MVTKRQALEELALRKVRQDLTAYKRLMYKRYQHAPHLQALDEALMQVSRYTETSGVEGIGRLMVEMPPRHGKTLTTSKLYPTWHLGRNPDHRIMLVSYGASLASKNSRVARNLVLSPRYRAAFGLTLDAGSKAADAWDLAEHEGGVDAMGIGGAATGKGSHLMVIDDVLKNREEAESLTYRDKIWDSYTDDFYTRLEPGGAIVVMGTRWHQDDLQGRLLRNQPETWRRLRLPALAEANDPLGRHLATALWPARFPGSVLATIQETLGPYSWAALYQQNPVPAEGGLFKRSSFIPLLDDCPPLQHTVRFWDLAMSERTSADYTVGWKIGQAVDGHYYIVDVERQQLEWGALVPYMAEVILRDGPTVPQGVEQKGFMSRAVQELNADPRLHNYSIWGYDVDKDKFTRALPFAAKVAAGNVHMLNRHWSQTAIEELCSFPNGVHDDQVDAASGAWAMLDGSGVELAGAVAGFQYGALAGAW